MPYHYHYDRESFLAGLAAGRALWRPPEPPRGRNLLKNPLFAGGIAGQSWVSPNNAGAPDSTPCMSGWYIKNGTVVARADGAEVRYTGNDPDYSYAFFMQKLRPAELQPYFDRRVTVGVTVNGVHYRHTGVLLPYTPGRRQELLQFAIPELQMRLRIHEYEDLDYLMYTLDFGMRPGEGPPQVASFAYFGSAEEEA